VVSFVLWLVFCFVMGGSTGVGFVIGLTIGWMLQTAIQDFLSGKSET
jgi:hypothetical protein